MVLLVNITADGEVRSFEVKEPFPYGEGTHTFPKGTDFNSSGLQILADALWDWSDLDWVNPAEDCGCYYSPFMAEQVLEWIATTVVKRANTDDSGSDDAGDVVLHITLV